MSQQPYSPPSYDDAIQNKNQFDSSQVDLITESPNAVHPASYNQYNGSPSDPNSGFDNILYKPQLPPQNQQQALQVSPPVTASEETGGFTVRQSFGDMVVRRLFVRKVFLTLGVQLLITFGFICMFFFIPGTKSWILVNRGFYYAAYAVFLVMYFVLVCSVSASRKHPWNLVMLILLTLALSYMVGTITIFYDIVAVLIGVGVTALVCLTVIIFSIQTKFDFTKCSGLLFVLLMVLFFFGLVTIFTWHYKWYVEVVYGSLGALVFTLFLAFDTQLVMGGRKYELDPEEYIFASLILYIDIIYIFLFLLSIFGGSSK